MKRNRCFFLCFGALLFVQFGQLSAQRRDVSAETFDPHIMAQARQSVISIECRCGEGENRNLRIGSGFIIHEDGFAVTRRSVVLHGDEIRVKMHDGDERRGTLVYDNLQSGLAIIKVEGRDHISAFPEMAAGLKKGSCLSLIGNSLGVFPSVSIALFRGHSPQGLLWLQAVIPPGNSGAPVYNQAGHVVAMLIGRQQKKQDLESLDRFGLAMPVQRILSEVEPVLAYYSEFPGWVGLVVKDSNTPGAVIVEAVVKGGPSDKAGIAVGDTIIAIEEASFQNARDLEQQVTRYAPKSVIHFTYKKGRRRMKSSVTVEKRNWFYQK